MGATESNYMGKLIDRNNNARRVRMTTLQGPHWRGGHTSGVVTLEGWSHWRGGHTGGVVTLEGWSHQRGGHTRGVVTPEGWSY